MIDSPQSSPLPTRIRQTFTQVPLPALITTFVLWVLLCLGLYVYMKPSTDWPRYAPEILTVMLGLGGLLLYLYRASHYQALLNDTAHRIHLGPIHVTGGMVEELGTHTIALLLTDQFLQLKASFPRIAQIHEHAQNATPFYGGQDGRSGNVPDHSAVEFQGLELAMRSCPIDTTLSHDISIQEDLVVKIGPVSFPVSAFFNFIKRSLAFIPIPARDHYLRQLIYLSFTLRDQHLHILVYHQSSSTQWWKQPTASSLDLHPAHPPLLAWSVPVSSLSDLSRALRDTVFMILACHGGLGKGKNWLSVRCFMDGLESLDEFRKTWNPRELTKAKQKFADAADADPDHYQAWYYYGTLLLAERTRPSIQRAKTVFERSIQSPHPRLRALAHAGLANCFAQQVHRLAITGEDVLNSAAHHVRQALEEWNAGEEAAPHPWILATFALVLHVSEKGPIEDRRRRYTEAAKIYSRAISLDPHNALLYNNMGWVFLKLAEWHIDTLPANEWEGTDGVKQTAIEAQGLFRKALEIHPKNKLSHANLCLLYSLPHFRQDDNFGPCRFHGLAAVKIDPFYIGGHRDLAIGLIRYGKLDEALHHFHMALRLCGDIYKGQEMTQEICTVLQEMNLQEELNKPPWRDAVTTLVVPRG